MAHIPDGGEDPGPSMHDAACDELLRLRAENAALRARFTRRWLIRQWLATSLVALTVVAIVASTVGLWARATVYDTDRFMAVVGPALDDPAFYAGLSDYVADASSEALDVEGRVSTLLEQVDVYLSETLVEAVGLDPQQVARLRAFDRPTLVVLAPTIGSALEERVVAIVDRFITSDEFRARFPDLVEQVHVGAVALATDDLASLPNVYIEDGRLRLDLVPVIVEVLEQVTTELREVLPDVTLPTLVSGAAQRGRTQLREQLGQSLQTQLPDDFGQLTLLTTGNLAEIQQAARHADRLVWGFLILTLVLLAGASIVSPDRRRTSIQLASGLIVALVIATLLVRRFETALLEQISHPDGSRAVRTLYGELASSLNTVVVLVAAAAMVVAAVAHLAGRPSWIGRVRQRWSTVTAPSTNGSQLQRWIADRFVLLRMVGIAIALGSLFVVGLEPLPMLLLGLYLWVITSVRYRIEAVPRVVPDGDLDPPPGDGDTDVASGSSEDTRS